MCYRFSWLVLLIWLTLLSLYFSAPPTGQVNTQAYATRFLVVHERHVRSTLAKQENLERIERTPPHKPTPFQHYIHESRTLNAQP